MLKEKINLKNNELNNNMKTKLFIIFFLGLILPLITTSLQERRLGESRKLYKKRIRHHNKNYRRAHKKRHHKTHHKKHHKNHRSLKRKIYTEKSEEEDQLSDLSKATKIGFKEGLKFAKRHLNEEEEYDEDHHHNEKLYHEAVGTVGALGFLGGTYKRNKKRNTGVAMQKVLKSQFAFKDSIINILGKEIQDLHFLNQKLGSAGRRIGSTENNMNQRLQEKIFELYSHHR